MSGPIDDAAYAQALDLVGGDAEFLAELVATYRTDGADRIAEMRTALAGGAAPELQRAAHTLKSSSATLGALALADACRAVEHAARDGALDGLSAPIDAIATEFEEVLAALDGRLGGAG
jgi:HPt (histidine-containing phosphotransfer) domain-containing protein